MAISLYRKYRPNTFADVVGQEHVENTLTNAVSSGDVAHAYLFCGPRGTGKTTSARLLAKALLCEHGPTPQPDGTCPQCAEIAAGTHPDVYELDAASRTGVENVREEIISRVQFAPTRGRFKIYIIDEVHMLSNAAFNALLKTLEEPPEHVIFVMCTTDPHKVPETIQSRCQRFDFRRFSIEEICGYLQRICAAEGFTAEHEALEFIAAKAAGGMRDATTALEQVAVANGGSITLGAAQGQLGQTDTGALFELGGYIAGRDTANAFLWLNRVVISGQDLTQTARDVANHMRDLYVAALTGGVNGIIACPVGDLPRYQNQAAAFGGPERLSRALTVCGDLLSELRNSTNARLSFEVALARLCRAESELTLEALAERIESLEAGIPAPKLSGDLLSSMAAQAVASAMANAGATPEYVGASAGAAPEYVGASAARPLDPEPEVDLPWESDPADHTLNVGPTGVFHPGIQRIDEEEEEEEYVPEPDDDDMPWDEDPSVAPFGVSFPADSEPAPVAESAFEPEPEPEPEPQPAVAPAAMSPVRLMAAIHTEVKREDVATDALLNGVTVEQDANGYHLIFPAGADFAMRLIGHGSAHELLSRAFANILGAPTGFDCRIAAATKSAAAKPAVSFGTVSATEAAAPVPDYDDGYLDAQAAYVDGYDDGGYGGYDDGGFDPAAYMGQMEEAAAPAPVEDEPAFDPAPSFGGGIVVDEATANNLADTLSVFGGGIKFEEV